VPHISLDQDSINGLLVAAVVVLTLPRALVALVVVV